MWIQTFDMFQVIENSDGESPTGSKSEGKRRTSPNLFKQETARKTPSSRRSPGQRNILEYVTKKKGSGDEEGTRRRVSFPGDEGNGKHLEDEAKTNWFRKIEEEVRNYG